MATSSVEICNSALVKIGSSRIASLSDDTKAAKLCNGQYDRLRKKLIRAHPWNFAIARVALAQNGNTPAFEYTYEYAMPSDVLRILDTDLTEGAEWEVETNSSSDRVLLTDYETIKIKYLKDVTDTTIFSPDFEEALSFLLASDIAYSMTNSRALGITLYNAYKAEVAEARSFDAQEGSRNIVEANEWIDVRF